MRGDRLLAPGLGLGHYLAAPIEFGPSGQLSLYRLLAGANQLVPAVALGQHALLADRRGLADLTAPGRPHTSAAGDGDPVEALGELIERVDHPRVADQSREDLGRAPDMVDQPFCGV